MNFESLITSFKKHIVSGMALSLICIVPVVEATQYNVTNINDDTNPGSLRYAITQANADPGPAAPVVLFQAGGQVDLLSSLPAITQNMTIANQNTNTIITGAVPLTTINNDVVLTLLGGNQGWQGNFLNNGGMFMTQQANAGYRGSISGTGNLVVDNSAYGDIILSFSGQSIYTGTTTIQSSDPRYRGSGLLINIDNALPVTTSLSVMSTLTFGNNINQTVAEISGSGSIVFTRDNTLTVGSNNNDSTYSGVMSGAGSFTKNGTGITTLSGANTATGAMTINSGTIALSGGRWAGSIMVNQNGTLLLTNNSLAAAVGNDVVNGGTITNTDTTNPFLIGGNFTQQADGIMNVAITAPGQNSQFAVTGNAILQGGTMNIILPNTTFIDRDEKFDIITAAGIGRDPVLPTVQSSSLFLDFRPAIAGNNLQLTADRTSYQDVNVIPALEGIARGLDGLITNDQFNPVLGFLDSVTSQSQYEAILEELAPAGLDGLYGVSMEGLGGADQALLRLDTIRTMGTEGVLARTGYSRGYAAGDMMENEGSYGPIVFGNSTKQESRNGLPGYNAVTAGFGFLGDIPILQYFRVGLGLSYANSAVKQANNTGSNTTIGSTQGLAYGSATYGPLFLDSVLSVGLNNYHGKRNMPLFNVTATSAYTGFQYGAKVKTGFTIPCGQAEISPTAGVQYMHLNVGQYTEKSAGILNQQVSSTQISTVRTMLGARLADRSQEEDFFPEIHAFYLIDLKNPDVLITSRFVAGGGSFVSKSALPPKAGINVGASLTALVTDDFVISGAYDLEAKKSFRSHSASLKFKFLF